MVAGADQDGNGLKPGQLLRNKGGQGSVGVGMLIEITGDQDKTDSFREGQVDQAHQGATQLRSPQA